VKETAVMPVETDLGIDLDSLDFSNPVADIETIRTVLPHRFEMEMLTAVAYVDPVRHLVVGYKDVRPDEFWVRGHMPGFPLLPGVLMCEAAAQLTCYYVTAHKVIDPGVLQGLGGIENARFHRPVRPGDRLVMVGNGIKVHRRLNRFEVVGFVGHERVFETTVVGVPIGKWEDLRRA
jgi:3-hydroxyacyl-[acyl-carrier-protein] dehydratase